MSSRWRRCGRSEALAELGHLRRLLDAENRRPVAESLGPVDADPTPAQEEIFNLMLYVRFFQNEFLPFLTEKRLELDYMSRELRPCPSQR
jgi:hypothetical protein